MKVAKNVANVLARIDESAKKAGKTGGDIKLVAVSKTVGVPKIKEAIEAGVTDLGENRVQEFLAKHEEIDSLVNWHLIGRLQKNKVKYIIGKTACIHSLDSISLAAHIERIAEREGVGEVSCLVQVNVSGEETKAGIEPGGLMPFLEQLSAFSRVRIDGLMTIAPYAENPEDVRGYFAHMKRLFDDMPINDRVNNTWLSMGMSGDYTVAIEEGANLVRVGSSIFGLRY